jgi:putative ABC transport system permease protein
VRAADPDLAISFSGTAFSMLAGFYVTARIAAVLCGSLGLLALVLSMTGLHGVLAQMVSSRVREIGLRIALGADRSQIARMILSDGFRPVVQGLAIGAFLGITGRFLARATAFQAVDALDPLPILLLPVPVVIAAFAACYFPARRAAYVDPNVALRAL